MLSAIGRAAVRRVASSASHAAATTPRMVSRIAVASPSARPALIKSARGYATATATKSTTGRKTTKAKVTAKKAPAKKAPAKKATATKAKKKPAKKAAVKKTKKPKVRKPMTDEEKKRKVFIALKEASLFQDEPKSSPSRPRDIFASQHLKGLASREDKIALFKDLPKRFANLSSYEMQDLEAKSAEAKRANAAQYQAWLNKFTPAQIRTANNARRALKTKFQYPKSRVYVKIVDARQPKKPTNAFAQYSKARFASGEVKHLSIAEAAKAISQQWREMSESEKQPYLDLAAADLKRYEKERDAEK